MSGKMTVMTTNNKGGKGMGILRDIFGGAKSSALATAATANWTYELTSAETIYSGMTPATIYKQQPHLRTVIDFLAENVAAVGLHTFVRDAKNGRTRSRNDVLSKTLERPNEDDTLYELIYGIVADLALNDVSYLRVIPTLSLKNPYELRLLKAEWVTGIKGGNIYRPEYYMVKQGGTGTPVPVPAKDIIVFKGWNPENFKVGSSKVATLKEVLAEQTAAYRARSATWSRGGRVGGVITRPVGAPEWNRETERKFLAKWNKERSGNGSRVGEDVLFQDGMTYTKNRYSSKDEDFIEGVKLSMTTVAAVFHVNPAMIGSTDQLNYANVKELRRMLYGETLAPIFKQLVQKLNSKLIPMLDLDPEKYYLEFNIREKLQGSFEEQAAVMQTLVGRPIMSPNEARPMFNLTVSDDPAMDAVATPLNMLLAGQTPAIGVTPPKAGATKVKSIEAPKFKSRVDESYEDQIAKVLAAFFKRQGSSVLSALGADSSEWWDAERWNRELSDDLYKLAALVTEVVATGVLEEAGFTADDYSVENTLAWLKANSEARAEMINAVTKRQLDEVLAIEDSEDDEEKPVPADVFEEAQGNRALVAASTLATTYSAFATTEAAKQAGGEGATKTWIVTSMNPRATHRKLDRETVGVNDKFSNGANWPGDSVLDVDDIANCKCDVEVTFN